MFKHLKAGDKLSLFGSAHTAPLPSGGSREDRIRLAANTIPEKLLAESQPTIAAGGTNRGMTSKWYFVEVV